MDLVCQFVKLVNEVIRLLTERSIKGEFFFKKQLYSKKKIGMWKGTFKNTHFKKYFQSALHLGPTQPILKIFSKCVDFFPKAMHFEYFSMCFMMVYQLFENKR